MCYQASVCTCILSWISSDGLGDITAIQLDWAVEGPVLMHSRSVLWCWSPQVHVLPVSIPGVIYLFHTVSAASSNVVCCAENQVFYRSLIIRRGHCVVERTQPVGAAHIICKPYWHSDRVPNSQFTYTVAAYNPAGIRLRPGLGLQLSGSGRIVKLTIRYISSMWLPSSLSARLM